MSLKNILKLLGIFSIPLVIIFIIWYIWFGPGIEDNPRFPKDVQGVFTRTPAILAKGDSITVDWGIPTGCKIGGVELQQDGEAAGSWMVATASCSQAEAGFTCLADLTDRGLSKGTTYRLQVHNYLCANGDDYVSTVTTFTL